jgi:secretion/DNA translocation related CpaE-like protein
MSHPGLQPTASRTSLPAPLLVSADPGLVDAVRAVASEAGVELIATPGLESVLPHWASAPLVLIDPVELPKADQLPSRRGVVVVTRTIADADTWRSLVTAGVEHIVELPLGAPWLFERLGRSLEIEPSQRTGVLTITAAVGGAGASSLAAALAQHLGEPGRPAVLVDLDRDGGGIDVMLGAEATAGARWDELAGITGPVDEAVLLSALPARDHVRLLSWSPRGEIEPDVTAVGHVLDAFVRAPSAVVVDMGRRDAAASVALARADSCVVLVPLRVRAVAAAKRVVTRLPPQVEPLLVVRTPAPGGLTAEDVAGAVGVEVVAELAEDRRRALDEEVGGPAPRSSSWRRVCEALVARGVGAA